MALGPDMSDEPPLRSAKSAAAFRTISEVAEELEVPQHVLRFWETKFTQIRPLKRAGGRRYYRPTDVDLLRKVSRLLYHEGYTIKGVQRLLRERGGKQGLVESPTALPFDFIDDKASFAEEDAFVPDAEITAAPEIAVKPATLKRPDRASRIILEAVLNDLLKLRALLRPGQD